VNTRRVLSLVLAVFQAALLSLFGVQSPSPSPSSGVTFVNGQWFTGGDFRPATFYAVNGVLRDKRPPGELETVDLRGGFVIPPFADAHNHFPSAEGNFDWANKGFLAAGVFYVLNPNDIAEQTNPLRPRLGSPTTVDVIFAHGGFTSSTGHPRQLYEGLIDRGFIPFQKLQLEGRAFYAVDSPEDVRAKWQAFVATNPGFVKIYLLNSERYLLPDSSAKSEGLRPDLAHAVVLLARAAHLRVGAHVNDADDYHNALAAGVQFMMHLPGSFLESPHSSGDYAIAPADIRETAKSGVYVVATASLLDRKKFPELAEIQDANLRALKRAGVNLLLGSDDGPGRGFQTEFQYLAETGVFSNLELLQMACARTPQAIFPGRKIGLLKDGYEASFLVLAEDPLKNLSAAGKIQMRIKRGETLK
jgi:imidazolonepropionase-like amidohydrolase